MINLFQAVAVNDYSSCEQVSVEPERGDRFAFRFFGFALVLSLYCSQANGADTVVGMIDIELLGIFHNLLTIKVEFKTTNSLQ